MTDTAFDIIAKGGTGAALTVLAIVAWALWRSNRDKDKRIDALQDVRIAELKTVLQALGESRDAADAIEIMARTIEDNTDAVNALTDREAGTRSRRAR